MQFDGRGLAADGVGTARANDRAGYAGMGSLGNGGVHGVKPVNNSQMGQDRIGHLINKLRRDIDGLTQNADVSVGINKTRQHITAFGIKDFLSIRRKGGVHGAYTGDLAIFKGDKTILISFTRHGNDVAVNNFYHNRLQPLRLYYDYGIEGD